MVKNKSLSDKNQIYIPLEGPTVPNKFLDT